LATALSISNRPISTTTLSFFVIPRGCDFFDLPQKGLLIDVATAPTTALALGNGPLLSATLSFLSSRAKPRDLQFYGPFLEMFSDLIHFSEMQKRPEVSFVNWN
jgi:hypothetical protein